MIGSKISLCDADRSLALLETRLRDGEGGYVCFTNVHAAVMGRRDPRFRLVTNESFLSVADGKPVYWAGKLNGGAGIGHVPGPDFMLLAMRHFRDRRHFLYGSTPEVLSRLVPALQAEIPGLDICGTFAPPFKQLTREEKQQHYEMIRQSGADFVWVGLGAPKQEQWMADAWPFLAPSVLLGVGAAFDFHSGKTPRAPAKLRHAGLEWLYRLAQEPRRLGKRYLVTNTLFLWYTLADRLASTRNF
ncbi:MAG: WecB/TagA/CpsF family glycosyltransferase [Gammaproteobacteria bacterium]|nr:WecB/TagA/CpsF family glycosyltransferase [Gammaproteobacteria bacterium]